MVTESFFSMVEDADRVVAKKHVLCCDNLTTTIISDLLHSLTMDICKHLRGEEGIIFIFV